MTDASAIGELTIGDGFVRGPGAPGEWLTNAAELRARVRVDDRGRYRPLSGARTMPRGWAAATGTSMTPEKVVDVAYPLALVHRAQWQAGTLRVVPLEDVLARQTGRYEVAAALPDAGRALARELLCGGCVRTPVWDGERPEREDIPCPEPCSVMVAFCREAALWAQTRPVSAPADPLAPFAAFEEPGNELREAYLARMTQDEHRNG